MRNTWTIAKRELYSYFASPIAWVLLAIFAVLCGYFTVVMARQFATVSIESQMSGQGGPMSLNDYVISPLISNMGVIALFLIPLISMRLLAEEKRQGTIELLATSPLYDAEIAIGKWLSSVLMYGCLLLVLCLDCSWLFIYGRPDWKPALAGLLGLFLQGAALLALGTFISSLTRNQIVAGAVGFACALVLWVLSWTTAFGSSAAIQVINYISIVSHLDTFTRGVIDSKDVVYYLTMIFLGLFLTTRSLESIRWRA